MYETLGFPGFVKNIVFADVRWRLEFRVFTYLPKTDQARGGDFWCFYDLFIGLQRRHRHNLDKMTETDHVPFVPPIGL